ncbi:cytochrome P450 [Halopolyspora algeriensis]|uniref:Cytochrome P450 n=1 Tax=Halopolyspora algeriensis TaxID=1500506 RepID=A0A368VI32_9ACTN|nr:cytochrome P450/oxidoreductase [Halopolyspora algeriensis]RCW41058.1 cytochrome P450 [Halopolyspora algeriensis]TQM53858.1 cytochrome P450 [Halopolyspora algeriensis]
MTGESVAQGCPVTPQGCPVSDRAAAFTPFGDEYQHDPGAALAWAREQEPVFYSPELGYWVVTRYEDVKAIFRDNITFSPSIALEKITPTITEADEVLRSYGYAMNRTLVNEDEPEHMPRRRVLMEPFTAPALVEREDMVRRMAREAVDAFVDDGEVDLVTEMLYQVPLTVAMRFLGVPEEDIGPLKEYSVAHTVNTWGRPNPEEQVRVAHAVGNFWRYAGHVLDKIRQDPSGPGWMQYSVRKQAEHPDVVTDSYLHSIMMAGIVAAHETTAHAAANAVKLLLERRERWEELCARPALIPNAVEECLRYSGSVAAWRRVATTDTEVGGVSIAEGSKLLIVQATANRDPRHFEDAERFDPRRESAGEHLTFGYGAHQCMGKNLARMELQIFLQELTTRLPHLELVEQDFQYVPNTSFRGPEHLRVRWDPARNPERHDPRVLEVRHPVTIGEPSKHAISRAMTVTRVERVAERVVRIRLEEPDGKPLPAWTSGAHIDVDCLDGDEVLTRQFSLCGPPDDHHAYEIGVLLETDSRGGSRWVHENAVEGATFHVRGPRNHFRLDADAERLVLVAGGIGITPVLAHADRAKSMGLDYEIHYAGRAAEHMAFLDRLRRDHGDRLHTYVPTEGHRMDLARVLADVSAGTQVYACGPDRMVQALEELAESWPDPGALHVEHFSSALGALDPGVEHAFDVVLSDSGLTLRVPPDKTVLQTLREHNIDIQSDCEEGLCGSCEAPVLAGDVDHRDVVLGRGDRAAHSRMMTCCSRACGDRLVLQL